MSDLLNGFNNGRDVTDGIGGQKPIVQIANDTNASDSGLGLQHVSIAKRKVCRCYEVPPKKYADRCDSCGKLYQDIRQTER